jgi:isocitrate dehydrogenase
VRDHKRLIALIRSTLGEHAPPGALVLDTLNRSLAGSESKDEDMADYVRASDAIREAFSCAVIVIHHCGIEGTRPRGHTSLTGAADAQIAVKRDAAHNVIATVEWMKDGPEGASIASILEDVSVGQDIDGEDITSCVVLPISEAEAKRAGAKPGWTPALRPLRQILIDMLMQHGFAHGVGEQTVRAVALERVRERHRETYVSSGDGDRADAERNAWKRNLRKAREADLIRAGVVNGEEIVWLAEPFIALMK